jgi:hypothetical protein
MVRPELASISLKSTLTSPLHDIHREFFVFAAPPIPRTRRPMMEATTIRIPMLRDAAAAT